MGSYKGHKPRYFLAAALAVGLISGCGAEKLKPLAKSAREASRIPTAESKVTWNATPPLKISSNICIQFMVDISGSNVGNPPNQPNGTDPTGLRFKAITNYVDRQIAKGSTNVMYSLSVFNDGAHSSMPTGEPYTSDASKFKQIVSNQAAQQSINGTIYTGAINQIRGTIEEYIAKPESKPCYFVNIHLSDGEPNVPPDTRDNWLAAVDRLMSLAHKNIEGMQLNTGLYQLDNADADAIMQEIADHGKGKFIKFATADEIDFDQFDISDRRTPLALQDFFLLNINTAWSMSGELLQDTDGDGIPDRDEVKLGSDPNEPDSDFNGVRDDVERFRTGYVCKGMLSGQGCARNAAEHWEFNVCAEDLLPEGERDIIAGKLYKDTDGDGLNDCEERLIGSERYLWDSNLDGIPDDLSFRVRLAWQKGRNERENDPDGDRNSASVNGGNNYEEIKKGLPIRFDNRMILSPIESLLTDYSVACREYLGDLCTVFDASVRRVPILGHGNKVKLYVLETTQGMNEYHLRTATKAFNDDGKLNVEDADFTEAASFVCVGGSCCIKETGKCVTNVNNLTNVPNLIDAIKSPKAINATKATKASGLR